MSLPPSRAAHLLLRSTAETAALQCLPRLTRLPPDRVRLPSAFELERFELSFPSAPSAKGVGHVILAARRRLYFRGPLKMLAGMLDPSVVPRARHRTAMRLLGECPSLPVGRSQKPRRLCSHLRFVSPHERFDLRRQSTSALYCRDRPDVARTQHNGDGSTKIPAPIATRRSILHSWSLILLFQSQAGAIAK